MTDIAGVRPVERSGPIAAVEGVQALQTPREAKAETGGEARDRRLDPAVTLDLGRTESEDGASVARSDYRSRYVKDGGSQEIVFQMVDPNSGTVMVQLPSAQALDARAYAEAAAAKKAASAEPLPGGPVERMA